MSAAIHCRNWIASAISSAGSGGGLAFRSAATSCRRASIGRQSCDADADVGEDVFQRVHDFGALRRIIHALDMDVNEAFAPALAFAHALEGDEPARLIALHGEDRMDQQADVQRRVRSVRR